MEPQTPQKHHLSRDKTLQTHTLRSAGLTYEAIACQLSITVRQAQYACTRSHPTPSKRSGRPGTLLNEQKTELIDYVCQSKLTRRLSYLHLSLAFEHWHISEHVIRTVLQRAGFKRRIARAKPPISEINRQKRLAWALEHRNWSQEQWYKIFWTDETWVTGGRHTRTWITRRIGEELDPTCITEKIPKRRGWMFWGGFNGVIKGPCLF